MNKEAIERTKARCKTNLKPVVTNGLEMAREARINELNERYQQILSGLINPKPIYTTKEPIDGSKLNNDAATKKHYFSAALVVILILVIAIMSNHAKADIYIKIGSGYKLIETDHIVRTTGEKVYFNTGGKISARIEIGKEHGNWSYGVSHHSQWFSGFPVSEDGNEYQKTELFIDYKWTL